MMSVYPFPTFSVMSVNSVNHENGVLKETLKYLPTLDRRGLTQQ